MSEQRPPLPPFDLAGALQKVQAAEDAWNTRDAHHVSLAYTEDSAWRNRDQFLTGRQAIVEFLTAKWERELDYVLRKSLWGFRENRIAVRFEYEWHDSARQWYRSYGNELWEFDDNGLMRPRSQHQRRHHRRIRSALLRPPTRQRPWTRTRHPTEMTNSQNAKFLKSRKTLQDQPLAGDLR